MGDKNTSSSHWREQGNAIYKTVQDGLPASIKKERLNKAANCYHKAFNYSNTDDEKTSAAKNLGMASWKISKVLESLRERVSLLVYMYKEAFKYFSFAYHHSCSIKPTSWRDNILSSARGCWEEARSGCINNLELSRRCTVYHEIAQSLEIDSIKADCYVELANCYFHSGISAIQSGNFKKGIYDLRECYMPVNEAKRMKDMLCDDLKVLEEDILMHQCMAESMQARDIGDSLYEKIKEMEELNMDLVWDIIDWYKQSVVRTREITEVEMEAIALSRLGRVYDKVLKIKYKAKEYLMRSIQLAHSMHPRTFHTEEWYQDCSKILEHYQQETIQFEEEKWKKEREAIMKDLEKEMKEIKDNDKKSDEEFLRFVYKTFPPKNPEHKLEGIPENTLFTEHEKKKKILQKSVVHYHPDRVDVDKHGKKWKVLSEEITKLLTRRYERLK